MPYDINERIQDEREALRQEINAHQLRQWHTFPAIVQTVDHEKSTLTAQPAIKGERRNSSGELEPVDLPLLVDVPIRHHGAGGFTITAPVKPKDEILIHVASRCIDEWYQNGDVAVAPEFRQNDLSDTFAELGIRSQKNNLSGVSTNSLQIRNDDSSTVIDVADGVITITAGDSVITVDKSGDITIKSQTVTIDAQTSKFTGNIECDGGITAQNDIIAGTVSLQTHVHGGVQTGSGTSGPPVV